MREKPAFQERLWHLWRASIEPSPSLKSPEQRQQARLLNGILVLFIPLAVVVLIIQTLSSPIENIGESRTIKAILMGIGVALLIYIVNHSRHYRIAHLFTVIIGFIAILVNAVSSVSPHLEILYLIMLPLMGMLLLSFSETVIVSVLTIISFLGFVAFMGDIPTEIIKDVITFMIFIEVFILFLTQQRNRLERDRQKLAVEQERSGLLNQLITNLSHDFRTPLAVIISSAYVAGRTQDSAQQQEKLDQIHQQALRLNQMTEGILTISALDQNTLKNMTRMDLNELLHTLHYQFTKQANQQSVDLKIEASKNPEYAVGDSEHIVMAVSNLIENAISYTGAGGQVVLRSYVRGNQIIIEVEDTGIGIASQDLSAIFTPFFRADKTRSTSTGGIGLGLSISKRVIELHDGTLSVESIPGQGSTFRIRLPAVKASS